MSISPTRTLHVLYFAAAREHTQCQGEQIRLTHPYTLSKLKRMIYQKHKALASLDPYLRWAVNQSFCDDESVTLNESDEVALIPPISGG